MAARKPDQRLGDTGATADGIPWEIRRGVRFFIGDCGGCGGRYRTTSEHDAARNACSGCDEPSDPLNAWTNDDE